MKDNIFIGLIVILIFAVAVSLITIMTVLSGMEYTNPELIGTMTTEEIQIYLSEMGSYHFSLYLIIPLLAFAGLIIGIFSYKIMSGNSITEKDTKGAIKMLHGKEREVVEKLVVNEGKLQQIELSRLEGMNKVKTHRLLKEMERKKIIKREKYGKVNLIVLDKDIYNSLK